MKYILLNPSFQKGPIEIDNPQAIKQIKEQLNNPRFILGDGIMVYWDNKPIILLLENIDAEKIEFKLVRRNKKEGK